MKFCYHQDCDNKSNTNLSDFNYSFMGILAQSLVYTIVRMTTMGDSKCVIREYDHTPTTEAPPAFFEDEDMPYSDHVMLHPAADIGNDLTKLPEIVEDYEQDEDEGQELNELIDNSINRLDGDLDDKDISELDPEEAQDLKAIMHIVHDVKQNQDKLKKTSTKKKNKVQVNAALTGSTPGGDGNSWFKTENAPVSYNIGTQINIGHLQLDISSLKSDTLKEMSNDILASSRENLPLEERPSILLGTGKVDPNVLSKIITSYYDSKDKDRRKYKGKHRKNSPMLIKLLNA